MPKMSSIPQSTSLSGEHAIRMGEYTPPLELKTGDSKLHVPAIQTCLCLILYEEGGKHFSVAHLDLPQEDKNKALVSKMITDLKAVIPAKHSIHAKLVGGDKTFPARWSFNDSYLIYEPILKTLREKGITAIRYTDYNSVPSPRLHGLCTTLAALFFCMHANLLNSPLGLGLSLAIGILASIVLALANFVKTSGYSVTIGLNEKENISIQANKALLTGASFLTRQQKTEWDQRQNQSPIDPRCKYKQASFQAPHI